MGCGASASRSSHASRIATALPSLPPTSRHRRAHGVAEPRMSLVPRQVRCRLRTVHLFQGRYDVAHRPLRRDPSAVNVRKVEFTVVALLPAGEPDGTPETLDVAQHLRAERVHARHPVTV